MEAIIIASGGQPSLLNDEDNEDGQKAHSRSHSSLEVGETVADDHASAVTHEPM